jgi:uncharacterized protein YbaR (Trm112 family)
METTTEFDGDMAIFVILLFVCLPAGVYYYFTNKGEKVVCPECRETAAMDASVCPNCNTDLDTDTTESFGEEDDDDVAV